MAKREATVNEEENAEDRRAKRRKFAGAQHHARDEPTAIEDINSARQLHALLRFQQDQDLKSGIQSFKVFLDAILYPEDPDVVGTKRAILEEFLQSQRPRNGDLQHSYLEDVMQTWSFASQSNGEALVGSVTAVLALLLKLLSTRLEFRQHGVNLCRTLLRIPQLKLIRRSLSAPKHKSFIISPVLRLLTEMVSFDGGVLAKELYSHREYTFEPQIIAHHVSGKGEVQSQDPLKPTVRSNAIRYVLANLKFQNEGAKIDIIKQPNINRALFAHVDQDSPGLVNEIVQVLRDHIVSDEEIPRGNKTFLLDDRNLNSILSVCRRHDDDPASESKSVPVQQEALSFLRLVCTTPNLGVLIPCRGWHSTSAELEEEPFGGLAGSAGETLSIEDPTVAINIRNTTLASFIHLLRPFADEQEMDLLVDIFRAAPELVADYFAKKSTFAFDPSLTATWIGYAAFLFSVVSLPPPNIDDQLRPPQSTSIVVDSLLPRPLNQKVLTRCLNHSSDLVRIFTARILIVAIEKLHNVVASWRERSESSWMSAADRLEHQIALRCPAITDVVALMRKSTKKQMQYEASARLLRLYYENLPWLALREKLDISTSITLELQSLLAPQDEEDGTRPMRLLTLSHLLAVAQLASGMQWWKKPEKLRYSPFTTLLSLSAADQRFEAQNHELLITLAEETGTDSRALHALLKTLAQAPDHRSEILGFVDECFLRLMRTPIKYADLLEAISTEVGLAAGGDNNVPPILMTVEEQLSFAERFGDAAFIIAWAFSFLDELHHADGSTLNKIRDRLAIHGKDMKVQRLIQKHSDNNELANGIAVAHLDAPTSQANDSTGARKQVDFSHLFETHQPPKESMKLAVLQRWLQDDTLEVLESGLSAPLLLLCSSDDSIRRQATLSLSKFITRLDPFDADQLQHYLLLNQLQETLQLLQDSSEGEVRPVSYLLVTFTIRAAAILGNPTHILYSKLNTFMNEGASWSVSRLPSYWMKAIIDSPPDDDTGHTAWDEIEWLIQWLYDGLRTAGDMDILRKCHGFERILALYGGATRITRTKILELVMRAIEVPGGSTTLITRFGGLDWCSAQASIRTDSRDSELLLAVRSRMWLTCDHGRVTAWSHGEVQRNMRDSLEG